MISVLEQESEKALREAALFQLVDLTWARLNVLTEIADPSVMMERVLRRLLGLRSEKVADAAEWEQQVLPRFPEAAGSSMGPREMTAFLQGGAERAVRAAWDLFQTADLIGLEAPAPDDIADPSLNMECVLRRLLEPRFEKPVDAADEWDDQIARAYPEAAGGPQQEDETAARPEENLFLFPSPPMDRLLRLLPETSFERGAEGGRLPAGGGRTRVLARPSVLPPKQDPTQVSDPFVAAELGGRATIGLPTIDGSQHRLRNRALAQTTDFRESAEGTTAAVTAATDPNIHRQPEAQSANRLSLVLRDEATPTANARRVLPFARSSGSPESTTPRQLTDLPELQWLLRSVVAESQRRLNPPSAESAQTAHGFTNNDQQRQSPYPLRPYTVATPPGANRNHHATEAVAEPGGLRDSDKASTKKDPLGEELLLDRLLDRFEERLREQAIRHLGFTGGLT